MNDLLVLGISLAACFAAAGFGMTVSTRSLGAWYVALPKPSWNPPDRVFGRVWTALYALMAIAAWLVWHIGANEQAAQTALTWFAAQLVLNVVWSVAFFGLRSPAGGLAAVVALWWAIAATIVSFALVSLPAALMLVPYLAWVTFSTALNGAIVGNVTSSRDSA